MATSASAISSSVAPAASARPVLHFRQTPGDPIATAAPSRSRAAVLASRAWPPGVPGWAVQRPRITKLIAEGVRWCPLTVVTGPPGAGKTMALALWTAAEPGTVAWVSLDEYDNRPGVFWSHVVAALRLSGVAAADTVPAAARGRAGDHAFLLRLTAALAAQDPPLTLVLDDLHLLTDPVVLDGLDFMLRNVGPGLRLVVCSRTDRLLRLHRYRGAGQLAEILPGDLAFTTAEAGLLLARHGVTLTADLLERLTRRTEGWAAGLRLAALSLRSHPDPGQFIKELIAEDSAILTVEPLSEREREVLRHVSGMLSTAEVASELHISVHTVKTHMRSILRKLAVTHRGEAVRRARRLGLI